MKAVAIFLILSLAQMLYASKKWANCLPVAQSEQILQEFWKADVDGGTGPDYTLKSGQVFSNSGNVCKSGNILSSEDWIKELKSGLSTAKSITSFQVIKESSDILALLSKKNIQVNDSSQFESAVASFLKLPSNRNVADSGTSQNSKIFVGESSTELIIVLTTSDGKNNAATLATVKLN